MLGQRHARFVVHDVVEKHPVIVHPWLDDDDVHVRVQAFVAF
jgi:hypothetical protein